MNSEATRTVGRCTATGLFGLAALSLVLACADLERGAPAADAGGAGDGGSDTGVGDSDGGAVPSFARDVNGLLIDGCAACHTANGQAGSTAFILSGPAPANYTAVLPFVNLEQPASSRLLNKGSGLGHGGGAVYRPESPEYQVILLWITGGAPP